MKITIKYLCLFLICLLFENNLKQQILLQLYLSIIALWNTKPTISGIAVLFTTSNGCNFAPLDTAMITPATGDIPRPICDACCIGKIMAIGFTPMLWAICGISSTNARAY